MKNFLGRLFGFRTRRTAQAAAADAERLSAAFGEEEAAFAKAPIPSFIGDAEQRRSARERESWMMSAERWTAFMREFAARRRDER